VFVYFVPVEEGAETPGSLYWQEVAAETAARGVPLSNAVRDEARTSKKQFVLNQIRQMRSGKVTPVPLLHAAKGTEGRLFRAHFFA
jgi:hypothetical protein